MLNKLRINSVSAPKHINLLIVLLSRGVLFVSNMLITRKMCKTLFINNRADADKMIKSDFH